MHGSYLLGVDVGGQLHHDTPKIGRGGGQAYQWKSRIGAGSDDGIYYFQGTSSKDRGTCGRLEGIRNQVAGWLAGFDLEGTLGSQSTSWRDLPPPLAPRSTTSQ